MRLIDYFRETRAELRHVSWATRRQAIVFTLLVIAISIGISLFLGVFDAVFTFGLKAII